ncbi:hypothetical protein [Lysinibacillus xylanilyticus]|uniref:hypothetical protein n=1 Tax=Lysinibacillus xylanilyticus TaxID=582475 RepID=UPI003D970DF2
MRKQGLGWNAISLKVLSWETSNGERDGIYVYLYEVTNHLKLETPIKTREGILDWKSINWILNPINLGIAEMVSQYLPVLLNKADNYSLKYQDAQIHIN